jgi:hypothetical protein
MEALAGDGLRAELREVGYRFQRSATQMLVVSG